MKYSKIKNNHNLMTFNNIKKIILKVFKKIIKIYFKNNLKNKKIIKETL